MTAYCIYHYTYDLGIPLASADQCILEYISEIQSIKGTRATTAAPTDVLLQQCMHSPDLWAKVLLLVLGVWTHHQCKPLMIIPLP